MLNRRFCKAVSCLLIFSVVLGLGVIPSKVSAAGTTAVTGLKISVGSKDATKTTYSMAVGKKKTLTVSAKPKAAAQVATFKSSDTSIVTVSSAGKVSALRPGTAKITVTVSSSKHKKTTTWVKIKVKTPDYYKVNESGNEAYDGERKKPKYNNKVCEALGLEFWTDEDVSVTFPAEGDIIRNILVKNTSGENRGFSVHNAKSGELPYSDRIAKEEDYSGSHAITANTDGSRIIVTMNTDTKNTCYCKTYYYKLTKKKKVK